MNKVMNTIALDINEINNEFLVVHPLFDEPEEKLVPEKIGPMKMSKSVKYSLYSLRIYLVLMILLAVYRAASMARLF